MTSYGRWSRKLKIPAIPDLTFRNFKLEFLGAYQTKQGHGKLSRPVFRDHAAGELVFRGKLLENPKEISSVALLSPACF